MGIAPPPLLAGNYKVKVSNTQGDSEYYALLSDIAAPPHDGSTWIETTASAAFSGRNHHTSVVFDNKMWVMGGSNRSYLNDVWRTSE